MNKIKYLLSAIPAALFATSAHADISVSGSGTAAYTDAGGNASSTMGGGVSFAMSGTTDGEFMDALLMQREYWGKKNILPIDTKFFGYSLY